MNVRFRDDGTSPHGTRFSSDLHHPVDQQQRGFGHPHLTGVPVLLFEQGAEYRRNASAGQHFQILARKPNIDPGGNLR